MRVIKHPNGDLTVPVGFESDGTFFDGTERITPSNEDFEAWTAAIESGAVESRPAPVEPDHTPDPTPEGVDIQQHGELGPVIADPSHDFSTQQK